MVTVKTTLNRALGQKTKLQPGQGWLSAAAVRRRPGEAPSPAPTAPPRAGSGFAGTLQADVLPPKPALQRVFQLQSKSPAARC